MYKQSPSIEGLFFTNALINGLHGGLWNFGAGSGLAAVNMNNSRLSVFVSAVSTPSGNLLIWYIPPLSWTTLRFTDVKVSSYDGLDPTIRSSQLVAYIQLGIPDQVNIARIHNGTRKYDVLGFLRAGSTITISGEAEFYA